MKIAVCTIAFNESEYIQACIRQFKPFGFHHLVLVSSKAWSGIPQEYDGTVELARKEGAEVIVRYWKTEEEQRNWGLAYLYDYDFVLVVDPDEFYTLEDRNKIVKILQDPYDHQNRTNSIIPTWSPREMVTYWKTSDYIFSPGDQHRPCIAIDPKQGQFLQHRCPQPVSGETPFLEPVGRMNITLHHLSWVHSDKKAKEKIASYSHTNEIDDFWYEQVWQAWTPGSPMLVRPYGQEKSIASFAPLPEEIKQLISS